VKTVNIPPGMIREVERIDAAEIFGTLGMPTYDGRLGN
jgi:hypothetical protein